MKPLLLNTLMMATCLLSGGCQWIGNTADKAGSYLPVIGERCEHWQCFTESGRAQSRARQAGHNGNAQDKHAAPAPEEETEDTEPAEERKSFPSQ